MNIKKSLILAGALACAASSWAIPAKRAAYDFTQPDGSTITLTLAGDEYCSYYLTDDGQVALRRDGAFYFATVGPDGTLAPSAVLASNAESRTPEQDAFLRSASAEAISDAMNAQALSSNLMQTRIKAMEISESAPRASRSESNVAYGVGTFRNNTHPKKGDVNALVVLIEYKDVKFLKSDEETHDYFNRMLNEPGFADINATGSCKDYFEAASMGQFTPKFTLAGPLTLPKTRSYYGAHKGSSNDADPYRMVIDALDILIEQKFDFAPFDNDGDGYVDNIFFFYAGQGEAQTGIEEAIWPHASSLAAYLWPRRGYAVGNGLWADSYGCSCELIDLQGTLLDGIGTFCHEYSHILGLPDLYNTVDGSVNYTPGQWNVMDQGSYNNNSRTPPTYSAFERNAMGWLDMREFSGKGTLTLDPISDSNIAYVINTEKDNEFYLIENRQKKDWDLFLPHHGMLAWHIDFNSQTWDRNTVNNNSTHQGVDLVEASGKVGSSVIYLRSYPFPGSSKVKTFAPSSWAGVDTKVSLTNITETDGVITADFDAPVTSGIADIELGDGAATVKVDGRTITVEGAQAASVTITDAMGRIVSAGSASATVAPGLYIVAAPGTATKVLVK